MAPPIDFAGLFRTSPNPYVLLDTDLVIRDMNEAYLAATGRRRQEIVDRSMFEAFPSDPGSESHIQLRTSLERVARAGVVDHISLIRYDIALPDGAMATRYWSATHTPLFDAEGKVAYVLQHTVDITELHGLRAFAGEAAGAGGADAVQTGIVRRAEAVQATNVALGQELRELQHLFDQAPGFMAVLEGAGHVFSLANRAYYRIVGGRELLGLSVAQAMPEIVEQGFIAILDEVRATGKPFIGRRVPIALVQDADNPAADLVLDFVYQPIFDAGGAVSGIFVQGHDVTDQLVAEQALRQLNETLEARVGQEIEERRTAERALQQAQRMESLGLLTGGVAHDFNNLLQVIASNIYLLGRTVSGDAVASQRVASALGGVERGAKLARQLLAFARRQPLEPEVVDLGQLVRGFGDILRQALGEAITLDIDIAPDLWPTLVDPGQIENVLLNLAINARDAMDGAGRLTVTLENAGSGERESQAGDMIRLSVRDTGQGMTREVLDKAFEPFFTTKPDGRGTGLGLSMVYGFVRQSGGTVAIESEPGIGTIVTLTLPRSHLQPAPIERAVHYSSVTAGGETILVAEDDEGVRETARDMLAEHGYRVLTANNGAEAIAIIDSGEAVDLLFTDVIMPGPLRGPELIEQAKRKLPDVAVLYTSGYTEDVLSEDGRLAVGVELLAKPYSRGHLIRKVREVLDRRAKARPEFPPAPVESLVVVAVEDDPLIRINLCEMLAELGHQVFDFGSAEDALAALGDLDIDLLVTDVGLPGRSGISLARDLLERQERMGVVLATGAGDNHDLVGAAVTVLPKPFDPRTLEQAIMQVAHARLSMHKGKRFS